MSDRVPLLRPEGIHPWLFHTPSSPLQDPALYAWEGMSAFGASYSYGRVAMTKAQYEESGQWAANRQYA